MGLYSFRQWVACVVMVAMLFNVAAPFGVCWCEGCSCDHHISRFLPDLAVKHEQCCCAPHCCTQPESLPVKDCCGLPEEPCQCPCGDVQQDNATVPKGALLVEKPNVIPVWHIVSIFPAGFADVSEVLSCFDSRWVLPPPPVPLHILLCVFRN